MRDSANLSAVSAKSRHVLLLSCDKRAVRNHSHPEAGFTLAALLTILTVLAVVTAYTVPDLWSTTRQRDREKQTIFVMKQYARAIKKFQSVANIPPTSMQQLREHNPPGRGRSLRKPYVNPLTGEDDWILVLQGEIPPGGVPPKAPDGKPPAFPVQTPATKPGESPETKDQVGPFIGVRPANTGDSLIEFEGRKRYEDWRYTTVEHDRDVAQAVAAAARP